jgi:hypothetical protein
MALCALLVSPTRPSDSNAGWTHIKIEPGAKSMSAAEKALSPDAASGSQHGIILIDETERVDLARGQEIAHRFRAKVFSSEARGLADVTIPFNSAQGTLGKWWGWTILPDGRVLPLAQEELKEQELVRIRGFRIGVLRGALPGVEPGSVIEYGYTLWDRRWSRMSRVTLQKDWPVVAFRYRWSPMGIMPAAFRAYRTERLSVKNTKGVASVLVIGKNLPAVRTEPWSPPDNELRAAITLYYYGGEDRLKDYWNLVTDRIRGSARSFAKERYIKEALASLSIPADADLPARLRIAYDWLGAHLANTDLLTAEQAEAAAEDEDEHKPGRSIKDLLERMEGSGRQLDFLFIGMARALGAAAEVVLAVDRTDHYLDLALLSDQQIDTTLVAVRAPGDSDDKAVVVDPGSGLPYGQIPWWFSGLKGISSSPKGARDVMLWPSDPRDNVSETTASITFDAAAGNAMVRWSRRGTGQQGLLERHELSPMTPDRRRAWLDQYCGGDDFEVSRAEAPRLHDATAGLLVECEATLMTASIQADQDVYRFALDGPWFTRLPELTAVTRVHPVVFSFPRVDRTILEIESPGGMSDRSVPDPVTIESPYGHYSLSAKATPAGLRVERVFSLVALGVPQKEYEELRRFLASARRADMTVLEFRRTDGAP